MRVVKICICHISLRCRLDIHERCQGGRSSDQKSRLVTHLRLKMVLVNMALDELSLSL